MFFSSVWNFQSINSRGPLLVGAEMESREIIWGGKSLRKQGSLLRYVKGFVDQQVRISIE